jgi:hypothetical protein
MDQKMKKPMKKKMPPKNGKGMKGKAKPMNGKDKPMNGGLTAAQKKLPPALQAAIMKKKKK